MRTNWNYCAVHTITTNYIPFPQIQEVVTQGTFIVSRRPVAAKPSPFYPVLMLTCQLSVVPETNHGSELVHARHTLCCCTYRCLGHAHYYVCLCTFVGVHMNIQITLPRPPMSVNKCTGGQSFSTATAYKIFFKFVEWGRSHYNAQHQSMQGRGMSLVVWYLYLPGSHPKLPFCS